MFVVKNMRKESKKGWTYLICDFEVNEIKSPFEEKTMWIAVEDKNEDMLTDDVYDAFVLVPLYLGMHYHQDVHIKGEISPRLYHNITHYLMTIFDNFSDYTQKIKFTVDGFKIAKKRPVDLVGTGISCGVDSLTTIYDNYIEPIDESLKINSLFLTNCGTHGDYENPETREIWLSRAKMNQKAADELNLPTYLIDSNLHAYTHKIGEERIGFLALYSCFICMQRYVKRYLTASGFSYDEILHFSDNARDFDLASYSESYMVPLITTERFELVIDGCQYTRSEKVEKISDWKIAQKYLNVCLDPKVDDAHNCSGCQKCIRTLIVLETIGKIDKFKNVFDIDKYQKKKKFYEYKYLNYYGKDPMSTSLINYIKEKGYRLPSKFLIHEKFFVYRAIRKLKNIFNINN